MTELDFQPFDCDNHYYEAIDAFTRHLDPAHGPRCVQWAEIGKRKYHVVGGKISRAVTNATFDPIAMPGAMHEYFRGNPNGRQPWEFLVEREAIRPEYRDRDARVATIEGFGLSAVWLFPTLGMLYEELLKHDPGAVALTFTAFNRWVLEDWGFNYKNKIFAAPYISLADPEWACTELEWALANDARTIVMRTAAPITQDGQFSPFDTKFDPFWARVNESGITVVVHAGDSGYSSNGYAEDNFSSSFNGGFRPSIKSFGIERAAGDFIITSVFDKLFTRFPNIRMASVENGSGFLQDVQKKLTSTHHKMPGYFQEHPVETLRRNWWINPFWEDDVEEVAQLMGADRVLFGSDWPHIEALPSPLDGISDYKLFSPQDQKRILFDNVTSLNARRPV